MVSLQPNRLPERTLFKLNQLLIEVLISQPISDQTRIWQSSSAATEPQPQRCTRSIPYCQRTIHERYSWPASVLATPEPSTLSHLRTVNLICTLPNSEPSIALH